MNAKAHLYQKFLVVGVQRTGSSALAELINTHPAIATGWEWSERANYPSKLQILEQGLAGEFAKLTTKNREHIESSIGSETRHLGFRRLFGASNKWVGTPATSIKLIADRFNDHRRWLGRNTDVRIIHIVRNNHIEWLKSKFVAAQASNFVGSQYPEELQIRIPVRNAIARVQAKIWVDEALGKLADTHEYLRLDYERFATELHEVGSEAVAFLGEDPEAMNIEKTVIRRQSTRKTAEYILNLDELEAALANHNISG